MARILYLDQTPFDLIWALIEDDQLHSFDIWPKDYSRTLGRIYHGRVTKIMPELAGAFVDIGLPQEGWLRARDAQLLKSLPKAVSIRNLVHEGEAIIVQIDREAMSDKGPRLTADIKIPTSVGNFYPRREQSNPCPGASIWQKIIGNLKPPPACLWSDDDPIDQVLRLGAINQIIAWPGLLSDQRLAGFQRQSIATGSSILPDFVRDDIAATFEPVVPLPGGGDIIIEQTRAFVTIDVNSHGRPALETNLAAASQIARQLNWRQLGGLILIDFIGLKDKAENQLLEQKLMQSLDDDPMVTSISGLSPNGVVEIVRKRRGDNLLERLYHGGLQRGWQEKPLTTAARLWRDARKQSQTTVHLTLPSELSHLFNPDNCHLFQHQTGKRLEIEWLR